jgi:hypothetical protein
MSFPVVGSSGTSIFSRSQLGAVTSVSGSPYLLTGGAFGALFQDVFSRLKHAERSNFERIVTPLDHLWYAQVA